MKFSHSSAFIVLSLFLDVAASAQGVLSTTNKKAIEAYIEGDNYRVRQQYREAIEQLKYAIDKDKHFFEAYHRLGLTYKDAKDYKLATEYFEKGVAIPPEVKWKKMFWIELGEVNMKLGDYKKVLEYMDLYLKNETINKLKIDQASLWKQSAEFSIENMNTRSDFRPRALSDTLNCFPMQYSPVVTGDEQEMIFTRAYGPTVQFEEDLVVSRKSKDGKWERPVSISANINSPNSEGICTVSADGRQLIFTSCRGGPGNNNCDLYASTKTGDEWSIPVNMGPMINSPAWESQPSLSADGRMLFFVSARKGGLGGGDIYMSKRLDDGTWTRAVNLGKEVNSRYHERSPFIHASGKTLFLASEGRPGFGGFDIFRCDWQDSVWSTPKNFGYPINNAEDQFSLFISPDGTRGYYSHEEVEPKQKSFIYEFVVPEEFRIKYRSSVVKGVVRDSKTGKPVMGKIELFNLVSNEIVSISHSDSINGRYLMVLTQGADYALYANASGYLFKSLNFNYEQDYNPEPVIIDINLDKAGAGATVVLNNIFFEVDSYDLAPKSQTELDKVAGFLVDNPKIKVEISGHTDDTGTASYNQTLSLKRAQSVVEYLAGRGIPKQRLLQVGHGSSRPLRPNDSEDNRQVNRRIEFRILP
jgi:OOP family OmpA-OmpF porin